MKKILYLVRHAKAMEREEFKGTNDSLRPLIPEGEKKFEKTLKKLKKRKIKIKGSFHSPFLRCKQSAAILEKVYKVKSRSHKALAHGEKILKVYALLLKAKKHTALIGHEPELSELMLLLGHNNTRPFKKGEVRSLEIKKKKKQYSFRVKALSHTH